MLEPLKNYFENTFRLRDLVRPAPPLKRLDPRPCFRTSPTATDWAALNGSLGHW